LGLSTGDRDPRSRTIAVSAGRRRRRPRPPPRCRARPQCSRSRSCAAKSWASAAPMTCACPRCRPQQAARADQQAAPTASSAGDAARRASTRQRAPRQGHVRPWPKQRI
jgi:hypothetical protein